MLPFDISNWPIWGIGLLFLGAAAVITVVGQRLTRRADRLADLTGWGEAIFGAVLLGGSTSLPGIVTSVSTAWQGYAELSVSNAVGGIAAQTTFLAIADVIYRKANLEHAAASLENLMQGALLLVLLTIPLLASTAPPLTILAIHPVSVVLFLAYLFGIRLARQAGTTSFWEPRETRETRLDVPAQGDGQTSNVAGIWMAFAGLALMVGIAGYVVAQSGIELVNRTGLSETIVGGLFTAVATSLPELVTSIAAVRQGALTLAVGGVIGGNCFDVLFLAFSDVAYREGSIFHAITDQQFFIIGLALLLTSVLLLGLLRREKSGIANIGFESFLILILYLGGFAVLYVTG